VLVLFLSADILFAQSARAQDGPPPPGAPPTALFNSLQQKQQPPPGATIKRDVDLVVLHTTVEDTKGQFVPDLKQDNFKVYEDKVEQRIDRKSVV
jgi:hypothetical protein